MGIPDEDIARVRAATDIVALIGEHAALKRQGRRWVGLCPFHGEKTPSFSVNAEEGFYYCFGCQAKGDAITFVREVEHLDFAEAVRRLADRAGIAIREDAAAGRDSRQRAELLEVMERATEWYHQRLVGSADAGRARDYLRSRGYDGEVVRRYRLGWAPDEWDTLCRALGIDEDLADRSGLGFVNRRGRLQDAFRGRILFPICDPGGRPVALGGRILPGSTDPAKYKNSKETAIYAKRHVLYGLNWAKEDVVRSGEVVVCEGYTDVIGFAEAGVPRAVATCGTALADEHVRLLRNFASRIVLAFDADGAGQAAAGRFYEWERRFDLDVAVASLPDGADPADLARRDPDALRAAVEGARPFLRFRVDRVLAAADLSSPEGRARAAERALEAVAEHPDDLVRDQYVMQVAERCHLEPAALRDRLERIRRGEGRPRPDDGRGDPQRPAGQRQRSSSGGEGGPPRTDRSGGGGDGDESWVREPDDGEAWPTSGASSDRSGRGGRGGYGGNGSGGERGVPPYGGAAGGSRGRGLVASVDLRPGLEALRLAIHRPGEMADLLEAELFPEGLQRAAFLALVEADDLHQAIDVAPAPVAELLVRLAVEEPVGDPEGVRIQLIREAARRELAELVRQVRADPATAEAGAHTVAEVRTVLEELDDPSAAVTAADRLVAWLLGRNGVVLPGDAV